jgi:peptidoglycan hydrolase-like protein with peptidoglycan-binding domain
MNSPKLKYFLLFSVFSLFFFTTFTQAQVIRSNLRLGSDGLEVKMVQTLLNFESDTQVSTFGAGSPGKETTYFGPKTRVALLKFQEKYGLLLEKGWIGPKTREILNKILNDFLAKKTETPTISTKNINSTPKAVLVDKKPLISSISPVSGGNNVTIVIKGQNFTKDGNIIKVSYADIGPLPSSDGQTLQFNLNFPENSSYDGKNFSIREFSKGGNHLPIYILISNINGDSNALVYDFIF